MELTRKPLDVLFMKRIHHWSSAVSLRFTEHRPVGCNCGTAAVRCLLMRLFSFATWWVVSWLSELSPWVGTLCVASSVG